jgi:ferric-dicitrate binding protein FerR (iron transport regulator)
MDRSNQAARLGPYLQEFLENDYVQENLQDGVDKLRAAYDRARKRRVDPTRDEKLRRQVGSAAGSIAEATRALTSGRRKPRRRWGSRVAVIAGLAVAGGVAALWAKERLPAPPSETGPDKPLS